MVDLVKDGVYKEDTPVYTELGTAYWFKDGTLHREGGPAAIYYDGAEEWFYKGQKHRIGGPAATYKGIEVWWVYGHKHREDGPAYVSKKFGNEWFLNDVKITDRKEFQRLLGLSDEAMTIITLKHGDIE